MTEDQGPVGGQERSALRGSLFTLAIAVLLVVALAVAWIQWQRAEDLQVANDEFTATIAARDAAADFMTVLFTYRHDDFETHEQEVLAGGTNRFDDFYASSLDSGTRQSVISTEAVSTATVRNTWVSEQDGDDVTVIVLVDTDNTSLLGRRQLEGAWFRVLLELHEGTWLVDEFTNVLVEDEIFDPADGGGTPTESPSATPSPTPTG